jgi:hypothetical protein
METDRSQVKVIESDEFGKYIKKLGKRYRSVKQDVRSLVTQLQAGETPGDIVVGNKYPVYKVRVKTAILKRVKAVVVELSTIFKPLKRYY